MQTKQQVQYYPSGLPWAATFFSGANLQPYKYGGKEFVEMHGLDEYDSEARWYYPAIMRTTTMDPLCEKYYSTSPYAWCGNNPVNLVDPDGRETTVSFFLGAHDRETRRKNAQLNIIASIAPVGSINNDYIVVWAHGLEDGSSIEWVNRSAENGVIVSSPISIGATELFQHLGMYNTSFDEGGKNVTILVSCHTGKGEEGFASNLSILSDGIVIAPSEVVAADKKGNLRVKNHGKWNVFVNGKIVDSIKGEKGALQEFLKNFNSENELIQKYCKPIEQE